MGTASETLKLPEGATAQVRALSLIAAANGSLVTLEDIARLTSVDASVEVLASSWPSIRQLSSTYVLENGLLAEVRDEPGPGDDRFVGETIRRVRATMFVKHARDFSVFCGQFETCLLAVSGSTSYQSVSAKDDLDFFCVTQSNSLWIFLSKALLLARFHGLVRKGSPRICFSYAVDEDYAAGEFSRESDALFARDALTTIVIRGVDYYRELLKKGPWMSKYFPRAYSQRTSTDFSQQPHGTQKPTSFSRRFLNLLLCSVLSRYIAVKSSMLNRRFMKQGKAPSLFRLKTGPDHCVFESTRYLQLRAMYRELDGDLLQPSTYHSDDSHPRSTA